MRKALFHIFFLSVLLLNTGVGHAAGMPYAALRAEASQKGLKANIVNDALSESASIFHKTDVLNDFDDYDEYDLDQHPEVFKEKPAFAAPIALLQNTTTKQHTTGNDCCRILYTAHNFSRLPRYDYLSLRVLRI